MSQDNTLKYLSLGIGALALAGGAYYLLSSSSECEEVKAEIKAEFEKLTFSSLKTQLVEEISKIKDIAKMSGDKLSEEFMTNVFEILRRNITLAQTIEEDETFNKRIGFLKEKNDTEYNRVRQENTKDQEKKLKEITDIIYKELGFTEEEYSKGFQAYAFNPAFANKLKQIEAKVSLEIQNSGSTELPSNLTLEKAKEIRAFAQEQTKKILAIVQASAASQDEFQSKFLSEVSKLDDIIYIEFGFRNTEVLKSFHHYKLVPQAGEMQM
mmetsp:Transcript_29468/g.26044  ORF Transcript_29468/g.26044 Transcript_29468/m.26044 type:complete len:268 (+) Transcript_29468:2-805(+)